MRELSLQEMASVFGGEGCDGRVGSGGPTGGGDAGSRGDAGDGSGGISDSDLSPEQRWMRDRYSQLEKLRDKYHGTPLDTLIGRTPDYYEDKVKQGIQSWDKSHPPPGGMTNFNGLEYYSR